MLGSALTAVTLTAIAFNPNWPPARTDLPAEAFARVEAMPDDPAYAPRATADGCAGQHGLYGFVPECAAGVGEERVGASVDRAWAWTTGHPDVVVAPLADGVDWDDPDLVARWALDPGELPIPATSSVSASHDANGDGAFDVRDYTSATGTIAPTIDRVIDRTLLLREDLGDVNGNGLLDPQDLLRVFSDGVDDDDDGYVDDIAGWDHVDDDNDPGVDSGASQAARTIAATANNGVGGAGACPSCRLLPMRVTRRGQTFGDVLARALEYATAQRASIVASFAEALDGTARLAAATDAALEDGVFIISTSGRRADRRRPVVWDPERVLFVGGLGYDAIDPREATTSLAPDPCAGFGASLAIAAPARCDDRGAALVAGVAALLRSPALGIPTRGVAPFELGVGPLRLLLTATAEDVRPPEPEAGALSPSEATLRGWDEVTGSGRVDALAAMEALVRRDVPGDARFTAPAWFSIVDPTATDRLLITGDVEVRAGESVAWTIAAATGAAPGLDAFVTLGSGILSVSADVAAELDLAGLFADSAGAARAYGDYQVTVTLSTRRTRDGEVVAASTRRVFAVHRDLTLLPAFPIRLGAGVVGGPRVLDLDDDGQMEIVVGTVDGALIAIDARGERKLEIATSDPIFATPSAARTSDGPTIVARGLGGSLTLATSDGASESILAPTDLGATSSPALFDLDADGAFEILTTRGFDLEVRGQDGAMREGWPQTLDGAAGTPAIGDVDGDGAPEIVAVTATQVYVFERDGTLAEGAPLRLPTPDVFAPPAFFAPSAALGDLDLDGRLDIVAPVLGGAAVQIDSGARAVTTARPNGGDLELDGPPLVGASNLLAIGRIANEAPSVVLPLASTATLEGLAPAISAEYAIASYDVDGDFDRGFPRATGGGGELDVLLADLDGDRRPEIVFGASDRLRAVAFDGSRPPGYPKLTGDEVLGTPVVEDLDGDGLLELVAVTRTGVVFVWRTRGTADGVAWNGHHHDLGATGNLAVRASAREPGEDTSGCGCGTAASRGDAKLALLFVLLLGIARRR